MTTKEDDLVYMPKNKFIALIQNKDNAYNMCRQETIELLGQVKCEKSQNKLLESAFENTSQELIQSREKCDEYERELETYRDRLCVTEEKSASDIDAILNKHTEAMHQWECDKEKLVDDYYNKHYRDKVKKFATKLGISFDD